MMITKTASEKIQFIETMNCDVRRSINDDGDVVYTIIDRVPFGYFNVGGSEILDEAIRYFLNIN